MFQRVRACLVIQYLLISVNDGVICHLIGFVGQKDGESHSRRSISLRVGNREQGTGNSNQLAAGEVRRTSI